MYDVWTTIAEFLGAGRYSQHSICLLFDPILLILYVAGDLTTWISYFVIGIALITKRHFLAEMSPAAIGMYGAFIFICGISHLLDVIVLWTGVYRLDVAITMAMAAISAVTAVYTANAIWGPGNRDVR